MCTKISKTLNDKAKVTVFGSEVNRFSGRRANRIVDGLRLEEILRATFYYSGLPVTLGGNVIKICAAYNLANTDSRK